MSRIPELDGVRGLAIFLVLFFHYFVQETVNIPPHSWASTTIRWLQLTWSGVDLFFVLSGFLIGGILYDAKNAEGYYKTFYLRRIHRIFPVYFLWFALFVVGCWLTGPDSSPPAREIFNHQIPLWSFPPFLQNIFMASRETLGASWIGVTWSLAVEEQFYFLLPFAVRHLNLRGITILASGAVVLAPVIRLLFWLSGNKAMGPYVLLPCRMDALGYGVLIAMACRDKRAWDWLLAHKKSLYGMFAVFATVNVLTNIYPKGGYVAGLSLLAPFYALLVLLAIVEPGPAERFCFRSRLLTQLGTVAYAAYIFHEGINSLLHLAILGRTPGIDGIASFWVTILALALLFPLCAISWRAMEKPLIRRAHAKYDYRNRAKA